MGGKRLQNVEDASELIIGKYYLVPCVGLPGMPANLSVCPVVGPLHEDAEFINFPHRHFHPDRRFVSDGWFKFYQWRDPKGSWSPVYAFDIEGRDTGMVPLGRRRMKMRREVGSFRVDSPWLRKLERAYCKETLREGHICPHRGISCRGVVAENDGVVCPGHGLKWNTETGGLVSRIGQTFQRRNL